jgi:VWFA-related protein
MEKAKVFKSLVLVFSVAAITLFAGQASRLHAAQIKGYNYCEMRSQEINGCSATVTELDIAQFPAIKVRLRILDDQGNPVQGLTKQNFTVSEEHPTQGTAAITTFQVTPVGEGYIAACLTMDSSGSMSEEMAAAKSSAKTFINDNFRANDRGAVIDFDDTARMIQPFTSNLALLNSAIDSLSSGGMTALFDAIALGVEAAAQEVNIPVVMPFTDGQENDSSLYPTLTSLLGHIVPFGIPVYTIGLGSSVDEPVLQQIASDTGGQYYHAPTAAELTAIYEAIAGSVEQEYLMAFNSPHPAIDGTQRTLYFTVTTPSGTCSTSAVYQVSSPILITRTPATVNLSNSSQEPGQPLTLSAEVTGGTGISSVQLFYRKSGTAVFTSYPMQAMGGGIYQYEIAGPNVETPGVDYYITATDGVQSVSDPAQDPADYPYSIPVQPNLAPEIIHTPVVSHCIGEGVLISAQVTDATDFVETVKLFYRKSSEILYSSIDMANTSGDIYEATIPVAEVTLAGIDYYIRATDNRQVSSYHGFAYNPHVIVISDCSEPFRIWTDKVNYTLGERVNVGLLLNYSGSTAVSGVGFVLSLMTPYGTVEIYRLETFTLSPNFYYEEPQFLSGTVTPWLPPGNYRFVGMITLYSFPVILSKADWVVQGTAQMDLDGALGQDRDYILSRIAESMRPY